MGVPEGASAAPGITTHADTPTRATERRLRSPRHHPAKAASAGIRTAPPPLALPGTTTARASSVAPASPRAKAFRMAPPQPPASPPRKDRPPRQRPQHGRQKRHLCQSAAGAETSDTLDAASVRRANLQLARWTVRRVRCITRATSLRSRIGRLAPAAAGGSASADPSGVTASAHSAFATSSSGGTKDTPATPATATSPSSEDSPDSTSRRY